MWCGVYWSSFELTSRVLSPVGRQLAATEVSWAFDWEITIALAENVQNTQ